MQTNYDNLSPQEATAIQNELREKIRLPPLPHPPKTIAGADISFNKYSETVYAGIVVFSYPELQVIDKAAVIATVKFPYIPGFLAFREVPALAQAFDKLKIRPDVLVLDGHGIAHPRRMGIASHFGVVYNLPTLGCAKSILVGKHAELGEKLFDTVPLIFKGEEVATVLRTKPKVAPVYISPGHLITMEESVQLMKACVDGYRIPKPTRFAHNYVNEVRVAGKVESS